ncbi:hypothetical protein Pfo_028273 [Paulownia fortunei]|nr:hypothetical protein Pfo_028273 [Paulownia fortunei]
MLQCQLAWDDEDWSKPCSAALREKIDHLEILIQSLKKEITDDVHYFGVQLEQPEKLAQRLHDLVKPLLENYFLVKSKQTESSIMQMSVLAADGLSKKKLEASPSKHNKKVEEKECFNLLEKNERKSPSMELEERKINHPQQKKDAIISKFIATDELSEKDINKLNRLQGKRMPNSAPVKSGRRSSIKSEPSDPMVKASSASTSLEKAGSREREERKSTISKAKVTQHRLQLKAK